MAGQFGCAGPDAVRRGVQQAEDSVRHQTRIGFGVRAVQAAKDVHPDLDVLPLGLADLTLRGFGQVPQVAVLDADQIGLAEREIKIKVDQPIERGRGVGRIGHNGARAGQQSSADPYQQFDKQCFLLGKCR